MEKFSTLTSKPIPILKDNIDTDILIPKQFLTVITKTGLGKGLFFDWRKDKDFELNQDIYKDSKILIAGENFGIGSSREHAVWALMDWGIKVVIAGGFSPINYNNSIKNGLLPIILDSKTRQVLSNRETITIDLGDQKVDEFSFEIDEKWKNKLLEGIDEIAETLMFEEEILKYEETH